ncbi:phospholipase A-2-activating protein isoform X1 [Panulirus ornatus]|uniref:phospholipase A-2-activating protein isoform X1 n=2 Tax=Panulirus ornatus TaxID=150431 RepID=UPI003A8A16A3
MASGGVYRLRCNLLGHSKDVRAVATTGQGLILTASRDTTAKLWAPAADGVAYEEKQIYVGHSSYVTSVCMIPGDSEHPEGLVATGSRDTTILIYSLNGGQPLHTLTGHSDTVSCLSWGNGLLVSGSWDHNGRVWIDWECKHDLKGHTGPLWSVVLVPNEEESAHQKSTSILTASADKTIKLWQDGKECKTYSGHKDCVRGLMVLSAKNFLSCSNDASVILWAITGEALSTYYGHTNFIYTISLLTEAGGFVTGGEDRTLRIWGSNGNCTQTIHMPAQSVWAVATLPNSDIVCGSSDGMCRVFTAAQERQADAEGQKEFEESVAKSTMAVGDLGGIKKSELPGKEILLAPGKRDGHTVMVRDGEKVHCYSWSSADQQWTAVGEVVGGAGGSQSTSGKVLYEGREYDFVFDVELDQGNRLKLPYNVCEDPYFAAQRFIHRHELPQEFLDQVATFIINNTKGMTLGGETSGHFADPFTGGARYQPASSASTNVVADPFTGSGRYIPGSPSVGISDASDPLTCASGSSSQGTMSPSPSHFFPQLIPLKFEACNSAGILSKLIESNSMLSPDKQLSQAVLEELVGAVSGAKESNPKLLAPLEVALQWPVEHIWPALDVLRLALQSDHMQNAWFTGERATVLVNHLTSLIRLYSLPTVQLLALRCLANMATHELGRQTLAKAWEEVTSATVEISPYPNKNMEIAAATVLLNYSVILGTTGNLEKQCKVLSGSGAIAMCSKDPEAKFRSLVALGTLLYHSAECRSLAGSLDLKSVAQSLSGVTSPSKVGECAGHILRLL